MSKKVNIIKKVFGYPKTFCIFTPTKTNNMYKGILKVSKGSCYSVFNGHTFEIENIDESFIDLKGASIEFPNNVVAFTHKEVIIVGIKKMYDDFERNVSFYSMGTDNERFIQSQRNLDGLKNYIHTHKIIMDYK